jgi:hypothetical protein
VKQKWLVSIIFVVLLLFGFGIESIYAAQYKGELVWTFHKTQDAAGSVNEYYTVKCAITFVANNYYSMQGRVDYPAMPNEKPMIVAGSGIVDGSHMMFTLTGSQPWSTGFHDTLVLYADVDKTTFNGQAWGNIMAFDTTNRIMYYDYTAGDLTLTSPPIPLGVSIVPQAQLLLDK